MTTLICLARIPAPGDDLARFVAQAVACRALLEALDDSYEIEVTLAGPFDFLEAQGYFGSRPLFTQQAEGDPGQRLCVAAIRGFVGGARQVILIGSDSPGLTLDHIAQAQRLLYEVPVVFGAATGGGYFLLGLTQLVPELFAGLPWGTEALLACSTDRLRAAGVPFALLPDNDMSDPNAYSALK